MKKMQLNSKLLMNQAKTSTDDRKVAKAAMDREQETGHTRLKKVFTKEERTRMSEQDFFNSNLDKPQERVSILDEFYYKEYKDIIPETANAYWLKHSGILAEDMAGYVSKDGVISGIKADIADEIAVRCTILVDLSEDEKK